MATSKKVKFKFSTGFAGARHVINPGDVQEVTTKQAKVLAERGFGRVERAVAAPSTAKANKPRPKKTATKKAGDKSK